MLPTIITNGFLLNERKIDALFKAGLINMGFSLQSFAAETHDNLVKKQGAHEYIMKAIRYCIEKRYVCSICTVPTNENLMNGDFDNIIKFANANSIRVNINFPAPIGRILDNKNNILSKESLDLFNKKYLNMQNVLPDFKIYRVSDLTYYCPMGEYSIYILPDGEVCPCTFTHISFGNILKDDIRKILSRLKKSKILGQLDRKQCPISMDDEFIDAVNTAIKNRSKYPPKWDEVNF